MGKRENEFQSWVIDELRDRIPGCVILKNDPDYLQGMSDILVLYHDKYAVLECKREANAPVRPNQKYYVDLFSEWSYGAFIYPENAEEVLRGVQQTLQP